MIIFINDNLDASMIKKKKKTRNKGMRFYMKT